MVVPVLLMCKCNMTGGLHCIRTCFTSSGRACSLGLSLCTGDSPELRQQAQAAQQQLLLLAEHTCSKAHTYNEMLDGAAGTAGALRILHDGFASLHNLVEGPLTSAYLVGQHSNGMLFAVSMSLHLVLSCELEHVLADCSRVGAWWHAY